MEDRELRHRFLIFMMIVQCVSCNDEEEKNGKSVFTLGAQTLLPRNRHSIMLCSGTRHLKYPCTKKKKLEPESRPLTLESALCLKSGES